MNQPIIYFFLLFSTLLLGCQGGENSIESYGKHYQKYQDQQSLSKVLDMMRQGADATYVKSILGEPTVDSGFDYRYMLDSVGENGCPVGAVFHFDDRNMVDQLWLDEICE